MFIFDNVDYSTENIINFLSYVFKIPEELIIDYCKKFDFPYIEIDMHRIFENVELFKKYLDLRKNINDDILNKDREKMMIIMSHYQFPEATIIEYIPNFMTYVSMSDHFKSLSIIYNKLKNNQKLSEDDYDDIDIFLDSPQGLYLQLPDDLKMTIINGFDEDYKEHFFKINIKKLLKKYENDDVYIPRLNGIPLHSLPLEKKKLEIFFASNYENVSDILKPLEQTALIVIINSIQYFHSFLVPEKIKRKVLDLDSIEKEHNILNSLVNHFDRKVVEGFEKKTAIVKEKDDEKYHLSSDFINGTIEKIPTEYNDLEKTMYVYYMLCYILTYDNNYYIDNKREKNIMRNSMLDVSKENNEVVCYQFASALKDILNALGIRTSKLNYSKSNPEMFVDAHQQLQILANGMVLEADSTRRGAGSDDLTFFKIGVVGDGIRCEMFSKDLQEQFLQAKSKVSKKIMTDLRIEHYQEIEEDLRAFKNVFRDSKDKSKKMALLFYEINKINLSRVDSFSLFNKLYNSIFDEEERKQIIYEIIATNKEWSVNIRIGDINFHYNFDTKSIECNNLSRTKR